MSTETTQQPKTKTAAQLEKIASFFAPHLGTTVAEAEKTAAAVATARSRPPEQLAHLSVAMPEEKKPETKPEPKPDAKETPPETKPAPKPEGTPDPKPEAKPEAKTEKPEPRRKKRPELDPNQIATAAAKAATEAVIAAQPKPEKKEAAPKAEDALDAADRRQYETLKEMERMKPEKKGVAKAFLEGVEARAEYEKSWRKQNPGKSFDPEDEDHNSFFEEQEKRLNYSDSEYDDANEARIARRVADDLKKEKHAERSEIERRLRSVEEAPRVAAAAQAADAQLLSFMGVEKPDEADDIAKPIINDARAVVSDFTKTAVRVMNGHVEEDLKNEMHAEVRNTMLEVRELLASKPPEERVNSIGQDYADPADYFKMTPAQQRDHWTITATDVIEYYNGKVSEQAGKIIKAEQEKFEELMKKRGYVKPDGTQKKPETTDNTTSEPKEKPMKTAAPSVTSDVINPAPKSGGSERPEKGRALLQRLWFA